MHGCLRFFTRSAPRMNGHYCSLSEQENVTGGGFGMPAARLTARHILLKGFGLLRSVAAFTMTGDTLGVRNAVPSSARLPAVGCRIGGAQSGGVLAVMLRTPRQLASLDEAMVLSSRTTRRLPTIGRGLAGARQLTVMLTVVMERRPSVIRTPPVRIPNRKDF